MLDILFSIWLSSNILNSNSNVSTVSIPVSSIEKSISENKKIDWNSWLVFDINSSAVLWWVNENNKLPIASLTKLMTALIIVENHNLDELVKISQNAEYIDWAKVYLQTWEIFSIWDLLQALLIRSWNDAAIALAEYHSWNVWAFVNEMNNRASELWLKNTYFKNPTWLDQDWHYSSAKDLALITTILLKNSFIKEIVANKMWTIYSTEKRKISFYSTNHLLWWIVKWVKTWTTKDAWECLITLIEKDDKKLLFILLGSTNRFDTTERLINFVFSKI